MMPLYYTIEKKEDSQSAEWEPLTDHKIDPEEASYLSKFHFIVTKFCQLRQILLCYRLVIHRGFPKVILLGQCVF